MSRTTTAQPNSEQERVIYVSVEQFRASVDGRFFDSGWVSYSAARQGVRELVEDDGEVSMEDATFERRTGTLDVRESAVSVECGEVISSSTYRCLVEDDVVDRIPDEAWIKSS